jgi:hypothetical protein
VAALATGLATAMAQSNVYSLNVVGYYNVTVLQNGLYMFANQLNTTNNQIQYIIPTVPNDTIVYKNIGGSYQANQFEDFLGGWSDPTWTLNPGENASIKDPNTVGGQTLTFVGEVLQGQITRTLKLNGLTYTGSPIPQQGTPTDFNIPAENDDTIFWLAGGAFQADQFEDFLGGWNQNSGAGPTINVGQGFVYKKSATSVSSTWTRNFTVQ